jgi:hypothetical protein
MRFGFGGLRGGNFFGVVFGGGFRGIGRKMGLFDG